MNLLSRIFWLLVSILVLTQVCFADDENTVAASSTEQGQRAWFADKERGWFFYEKPKPIVKPKPKEAQPEIVQAPPVPQMLAPRDILKKQGEDYENAAAEAILHPTAANYRDYLMKTQKILGQSQDFAEGLKAYTYAAPELDYTLQNPQGNGVQIKNIAKNEDKSKALVNYSRDNAIIFVFRSDCPYCHKFAPIVKYFAAMYGYVVLPISMDAKGLPEYPNPRYSPALLQKLQPQAVPAVYMLNPKENKVSTVGFGLTDTDTLGDKIIAAMSRNNATGQ
jgi:conjugal transfer pilus assembly protein TraF